MMIGVSMYVIFGPRILYRDCFEACSVLIRMQFTCIYLHSNFGSSFEGGDGIEVWESRYPFVTQYALYTAEIL
jgi:hypothetical protein